MREPNH